MPLTFKRATYNQHLEPTQLKRLRSKQQFKHTCRLAIDQSVSGLKNCHLVRSLDDIIQWASTRFLRLSGSCLYLCCASSFNWALEPIEHILWSLARIMWRDKCVLIYFLIIIIIINGKHIFFFFFFSVQISLFSSTVASIIQYCRHTHTHTLTDTTMQIIMSSYFNPKSWSLARLPIKTFYHLAAGWRKVPTISYWWPP